MTGSMFPTPDFEPPSGEPSWAWIAGLLAAGALCVIVILAVSS